MKNFGTVDVKFELTASGSSKIENLGAGVLESRKIVLGNSTVAGIGEMSNESQIKVGTLAIAQNGVYQQFPGSILTTAQLINSGAVSGDAAEYSSVNFEPYSKDNLLSPNTSLELTTASRTFGALKMCVGDEANRKIDGFLGTEVLFDCEPGTPAPVGLRGLVHRAENKGCKNYELSNHLGNVLTTVSDRRIGVALAGNPSLIAYYSAVINSSNDYYAFGSPMPGRGYKGNNDYRYGFNGKEDDKETGYQDYGMRMYNPKLARFFSVDPITAQYEYLTPYQFASNIPIMGIDLDGLEFFGVSPIVAGSSSTIIVLSESSTATAGASTISRVSPTGYRGGPIDVEGATIEIAPLSQPTTGSGSGAFPWAGWSLSGTPEQSPQNLKAPQQTADAKPDNDSEYDKGKKGEKKFYVTYTKVSKDRKTVYSGRTSGSYTGVAPTPAEIDAAVKRRDSQHYTLNKHNEYEAAEVDKSSTDYNAIRGREQELIDYHGGARTDGGTGRARNQIRGYSRINPNRIWYKMAALARKWTLVNNNPTDKPKK